LSERGTSWLATGMRPNEARISTPSACRFAAGPSKPCSLRPGTALIAFAKRPVKLGGSKPRRWTQRRQTRAALAPPLKAGVVSNSPHPIFNSLRSELPES
jgi:hypothetical protein